MAVLEPGAKWPEGIQGRVEPEESGAVQRAVPENEREGDPLLRMLDCAGPTGIRDLAVNLDHGLYGPPKITDDWQPCFPRCQWLDRALEHG